MCASALLASNSSSSYVKIFQPNPTSPEKPTKLRKQIVTTKVSTLLTKNIKVAFENLDPITSPLSKPVERAMLW